MHYGIRFEALDEWQLALMVAAARSANVPCELDAEAQAAVRRVQRGVELAPIRTRLPGRARAQAMPQS